MATMQVVYSNDKPYTFSAERIQINQLQHELLISVHKAPKHITNKQVSLKSETVLLQNKELLGWVYKDGTEVKAHIYNPHNQQRFWQIVSALPTPNNVSQINDEPALVETLVDSPAQGTIGKGIVPSFLRKQA